MMEFVKEMPPLEFPSSLPPAEDIFASPRNKSDKDEAAPGSH
jgi:hypothetical protein